MKRWMWAVPLWMISIIIGLHLVRAIVYQVQFHRYILALEENNAHRLYFEGHFIFDEWVELMYTMRDIRCMMESALAKELGPEYFHDVNEFLEKQLNQDMAFWVINSPYYPMEELEKVRSKRKTVEDYKMELKEIHEEKMKHLEKQKRRKQQEEAEAKKGWRRGLYRNWTTGQKHRVTAVGLIAVLFLMYLLWRLIRNRRRNYA